MVNFTKYTLTKLENIIKDMDYSLRYERGHFKSGYCLVKDSHIVVINKFLDTEGRINTLLEIISEIGLEEKKIDNKRLKWLKRNFTKTLSL